jgi:hypothetical protein
MDELQEPIDSECYTPSSEIFRRIKTLGVGMQRRLIWQFTKQLLS